MKCWTKHLVLWREDLLLAIDQVGTQAAGRSPCKDERAEKVGAFLSKLSARGSVLWEDLASGFQERDAVVAFHFADELPRRYSSPGPRGL